MVLASRVLSLLSAALWVLSLTTPVLDSRDKDGISMIQTALGGTESGLKADWPLFAALGAAVILCALSAWIGRSRRKGPPAAWSWRSPRPVPPCGAQASSHWGWRDYSGWRCGGLRRLAPTDPSARSFGPGWQRDRGTMQFAPTTAGGVVLARHQR